MKDQKYKLINRKTGEETLCDKVTIDGFDYYVSDEIEDRSGKIAYINNNVYKNELRTVTTVFGNDNLKDCKKILATNNPKLDIPKVVDDGELRDMLFVLDGQKVYTAYMNDHNSETALGGFLRGCKHGYNKAKEQFGNSDEDMIEFAKWIDNNSYFQNHKDGEWFFNDFADMDKDATLIASNTKELLQLWKEQQPKIVYYV